jgi:hypothetical protein
MSTGHYRYEAKSEGELYKLLGQGDTAKIYARKPRIDTSFDWPYGGGNSVDGKCVYIDRALYREVMNGVVYVRGMTPSQIIQAWVDHEHTEKAVMDGDNAVDSYPPAHGFATTKEHRFVKMLPVNPDRYEECIESGLKRCLKRFIKLGTKANPPRDVWCGPVLDDPDGDDREIIRILRAKGVRDAFKMAKADAHYGFGGTKCVDCKFFGDGQKTIGVLRPCARLSGLVRANRNCDYWSLRKGA